MQPVENPTPAQSTAVNNQLGTTENGQQSPTTFAEAVKAQHERAPPQAPQASKLKRPTSAPNRTAAKPRQRTAPSTRLVVDLAGSRPTKKPHPDSLCRAINDALDGRLAVSAVSTSRNGNLVLHATAPACSAQALAAHHALIWKALAPLLGVVDATEPPFYPADPWHKVVFHRVPLMRPGVLPTSREAQPTPRNAVPHRERAVLTWTGQRSAGGSDRPSRLHRGGRCSPLPARGYLSVRIALSGYTLQTTGNKRRAALWR
ncbi:hypothetical protein B0H11DRAFT_2342580 [Mycena galericulata]|nr:hypothetical protein B0H11DRAFT_2342580 [Mycena galericulata]